MHLDASCHCSAAAKSAVPFMHGHCSVCRKTAGGGGAAVKLGADARTLKVRGRTLVGAYHAVTREPSRF